MADRRSLPWRRAALAASLPTMNHSWFERSPQALEVLLCHQLPDECAEQPFL
jgi:hypothetical protein